MNIKDVKPGTVESVSGVAKEKSETREVLNRYGKRTSVADVTLEDDSGEIKLSLWGDDIDKVKAGDHVEIKNGWASIFRDKTQISVGKNGQLIVKPK